MRGCGRRRRKHRVEVGVKARAQQSHLRLREAMRPPGLATHQKPKSDLCWSSILVHKKAHQSDIGQAPQIEDSEASRNLKFSAANRLRVFKTSASQTKRQKDKQGLTDEDALTHYHRPLSFSITHMHTHTHTHLSFVVVAG